MAGFLARRQLARRQLLIDPVVSAPGRVLRAGTFALASVVLVLSFRAKSDGAAPSLAVVILSVGFVAILVWPLTARERHRHTVVAGLLAIELILRSAFLFTSTGELAHSGSAGLFCSPAARTSSTSCLPTERGGLLLLAVQVIAAVIMACWLQRADATMWQFARYAVRAVTSVVAATARTLVAAVTAIPAPAMVARPRRNPWHNPPLASREVLLARKHSRRGPPCLRALAPTAPATLSLSF